MRRRSLLALPLFVLLASCATEPVGATYSLSGFVTQALASGVTTTPIGGATVTFTSDVGERFTTTTGGDGRYRMQFLSRAAFGQVRAEAGGFTPSERTVYFDTPERRIDIGLRPSTSM